MVDPFDVPNDLYECPDCGGLPWRVYAGDPEPPVRAAGIAFQSESHTAVCRECGRVHTRYGVRAWVGERRDAVPADESVVSDLAVVQYLQTANRATLEFVAGHARG